MICFVVLGYPLGFRPPQTAPNNIFILEVLIKKYYTRIRPVWGWVDQAGSSARLIGLGVGRPIDLFCSLKHRNVSFGHVRTFSGLSLEVSR